MNALQIPSRKPDRRKEATWPRADNRQFRNSSGAGGDGSKATWFSSHLLLHSFDATTKANKIREPAGNRLAGPQICANEIRVSYLSRNPRSLLSVLAALLLRRVDSHVSEASYTSSVLDDNVWRDSPARDRGDRHGGASVLSNASSTS